MSSSTFFTLDDRGPDYTLFSIIRCRRGTPSLSLSPSPTPSETEAWYDCLRESHPPMERETWTWTRTCTWDSRKLWMWKMMIGGRGGRRRREPRDPKSELAEILGR